MLALPEHIDRACINLMSSFGDIGKGGEVQLTLLRLRASMMMHLHSAISTPGFARENIQRWYALTEEALVKRAVTTGRDYERHLRLAQVLRSEMVKIVDGFKGGTPGKQFVRMAYASGLIPKEIAVLHSLRLSVYETQRLIHKVEEVRFDADNVKKRIWLSGSDEQFVVEWENKVLVFESILQGQFKLCPRLAFVFNRPTPNVVIATSPDIDM